MSISFNQIPTDRLTPFVYVEFDNTRAVSGPGIKSLKSLIIAGRTSDGSIAELVPKLISSPSQAADYFGDGSQVHEMVTSFKQNNDTGELWAIGLDDSGAKASADFTFSGTATEDGTVTAYIAGHRVKIDVENGDTAAEIATAFETELAKLKNQYLPVTYLKSSGTMNLIAKNAGVVGNEMDLRLNFYEGEALPAGISCVTTGFAGGASAPDIQDALDVLGAEQYDVIAHPYTDNSNMTAIKNELETRWGPLTQNDGVGIAFKNDSYADLVTLSASHNSPHHVLGGINSSPTAPWRIAASIAGNVAFSGQIDPARPFQTLKLFGVLAPAVTDRFTATERNILLQNGIGTLMIDSSGDVRIERLVTTYKTNAFGAPDVSYQDLNTVMTLSYLRYDFRNYILRKYPRHKLANDGTRFSAGQAIMTPNLMKSEAVLKFTEWESIGLVEGFSQFKADLVVERNVSNQNRLDVLLPLDVVNQLTVVGTQIQFLL